LIFAEVASPNKQLGQCLFDVADDENEKKFALK
jgi:hypothetical protein